MCCQSGYVIGCQSVIPASECGAGMSHGDAAQVWLDVMGA